MIPTLAAALFLVAPGPAAAADADVRLDIAAAMAASAAGWNAGSLDRFMGVYADDAVMVTSNGLLRGKPEIAARYRPSFAGGRNARGALSFRMLAYRTIGSLHQLLVARWTLTPADPAARPETGMTTLLFERRREGWKIISDHSS